MFAIYFADTRKGFFKKSLTGRLGEIRSPLRVSRLLESETYARLAAVTSP